VGFGGLILEQVEAQIGSKLDGLANNKLVLKEEFGCDAYLLKPIEVGRHNLDALVSRGVKASKVLPLRGRGADWPSSRHPRILDHPRHPMK